MLGDEPRGQGPHLSRQRALPRVDPEEHERVIEQKKSKGTILVVVGTVLVLLTVVLLLSLQRPTRPPGPEREGGQEKGSSQTRALRSSAQGQDPTRMPPPPPGEKRAQVRGTVEDPPGASAGSAARPAVRVIAPPAVPSEIQRETDPVRRAQLEKMHRLATARVRLGMLRHRGDLLRTSLERAKKDGSWAPEKVRQAEQDLQEISAAVGLAEKHLEKTRSEVGGDIDK
jgi:hypothetical protein